MLLPVNVAQYVTAWLGIYILSNSLFYCFRTLHCTFFFYCVFQKRDFQAVRCPLTRTRQVSKKKLFAFCSTAYLNRNDSIGRNDRKCTEMILVCVFGYVSADSDEILAADVAVCYRIFRQNKKNGRGIKPHPTDRM